MQELDLRLERWAQASEIQQLSGTEAKSWKESQGRCTLPKMIWSAPRLAGRQAFGDQEVRESWLWWTATFRLLRVAGKDWSGKAGKEIKGRGQQLLREEFQSTGGRDEKLHWVVLLVEGPKTTTRPSRKYTMQHR